MPFTSQLRRTPMQRLTEASHGGVVVPALDPDFADREAQLRLREPGVAFAHCRRHGWNAVRDGGVAPSCPMCLAAREVNRDNTEYVRRLFTEA